MPVKEVQTAFVAHLFQTLKCPIRNKRTPYAGLDKALFSS